MTLPYTASADRVLQLAQAEAERFGHEYVGTEHLLLAAVREDACDAAAVLCALGVTADRVREQIGRIIPNGPPGEQVVFGRLPRTPRTLSVLARAAAAAQDLGDAVGPEHLLLGLMDEAAGRHGAGSSTGSSSPTAPRCPPGPGGAGRPPGTAADVVALLGLTRGDTNLKKSRGWLGPGGEVWLGRIRSC